MLVRRFQPEEWVEIARGQRRKPRRHSAIAELEIILELPINSLLHSNPPKQGRRPTTGTSQSSSQANRRGAGPQARLSFTQDCRKHTIRLRSARIPATTWYRVSRSFSSALYF